MAVSRCICKQVPFTELKELADSGIRDIEELSRLTHCGTGCGMCIPYIRVMLITGITDLPVLSANDLRGFTDQHRPPATQPSPQHDHTLDKEHP